MTARPDDNDLFTQAISYRLRASAAGLDPAVVAALDVARRRAVTAAGARGSWAPMWRPVPLAMAAATAGLAVMVGWAVMRVPTGLPDAPDGGIAADMEIVLAGDSLEMLEELEFYAWLTDQPDAG